MSEGPTVAVAELLGHVIIDVFLAEGAHAEVDVGVRILGENPLRGQGNKDESTDGSGMASASAVPISGTQANLCVSCEVDACKGKGI